MQKVKGDTHPLNIILSQRYTIPYYQREYKWQRRQAKELVFDLVSEFRNHYREDDSLKDVTKYGIYFLGPIITTESKEIIDGQQRMTTLSLILIKLNHMQTVYESKINIEKYIFSDDLGERTFVINEPERENCLSDLFYKDNYETKKDDTETVKNIKERYDDVSESLDDEFADESLILALQHFIEWLKHRVYIVNIETATQGDAHKVFENMNDRGLRLSSVEMIKGHLLSQVNEDQRTKANKEWRDIMQKLNAEKDGDITFIHTWFRAKYADTMRERRASAESMDFESIYDNANKWLLDNLQRIGIKTESDYERFIFKDLDFFAGLYMRLIKYSTKLDKRFEYVFYNAHRDFNLQIQAIMSAVNVSDSAEDIDRKIRIISCFFDQFITLRVVNYHSVEYSNTYYRAFIITKELRGKTVADILRYTKDFLVTKVIPEGSLSSISEGFHLNQFSKRYIFHMLARMISYMNEQCGIDSDFDKIVDRKKTNSLDIEHIWADDYSQGNHSEEFANERDFKDYRERFGNLLLLPRDKNRSYQKNPYEEKVQMYFSDNILARSLNRLFYKNNPSFLRFVSESGLPFVPYDVFNKADLDERQELYRAICEKIWNIDNLDRVAK